MTSGWEQAKLQELRAKTDRQLLTLVHDELEVAVRSESNGDYARAARAYVEATRLVPLLNNLSSAERARLEARLQLLANHFTQEAPCVC